MAGQVIAIGWAVLVVGLLVYYGLDLDHRCARWQQHRYDRESLKHAGACRGEARASVDVDFEAWLELPSAPNPRRRV